MTDNLLIRPMTADDIDDMVDAFERIGWTDKNRARFEDYLAAHENGERSVFVARKVDEFVGYVTVVWQSGHYHFREAGIPEIVDLNVLPDHRKGGIGTALIGACERLAATRDYAIIGLGVVQEDPDYAAARRLYPTLGYIPDGNEADSDNVKYLTKAIG